MAGLIEYDVKQKKQIHFLTVILTVNLKVGKETQVLDEKAMNNKLLI